METACRPVLYMAPLKGVTDHLFRTAFATHFGGFDLAVAPFISSKRDLAVKRKYVKDLLPENNRKLPAVPQILGRNPDDFLRLANYLHGIGYECVNWNLGCPSPMVANKKRGSGLLPYTDAIRQFLDRAVGGMNGSLSIKTRLGWERPDDIFRLIPVLNEYPLAEVMVHPRTGVQRYAGAVDLAAFEACRRELRHPVVYNGDIRTLDDYRRLSGRLQGVRRWMIGRGCIADPFLPRSIQTGGVLAGDTLARMKAFHTALFIAYQRTLDGPGHVLNKMKGYWRYFGRPLAGSQRAFKRILKARCPDHYLEMVNHFFDSEARVAGRSEPEFHQSPAPGRKNQTG